MKSKLFIIVALLSCAMFVLSCANNAALTSGKLYLGQENLEKAQEQLETAVQQVPENPEAHYLLGVVYGKKGMFEQMNTEFSSAVKLDPAKEPLVNRGDRRYWEGCEPLWIEWYNNGISMLNARKFDEALKYFDGATKIWPTKDKAFSQLGYVYSVLGRNEEAIAAVKKSVELAPQDLQNQLNLAATYFNLSMYDDAITAYKRVTELDPQRADAWRFLGQAYEQQQKVPEAINAYEKAIGVVPNEKDLYYNVGVLYAQEKDFDEAIPNFRKAMELDPNDIDATYNLALVYFNKEQYDDALPLLETVVERDPMHADAWDAIGIIYVRKGAIEKGKAAMERGERIRTEGMGDGTGAITMEKYNGIQVGMRYDEVVRIIGFLGKEATRSEGVVMYTWSDSSGSNISVTFQNGQVTTKAQAGL